MGTTLSILKGESSKPPHQHQDPTFLLDQMHRLKVQMQVPHKTHKMNQPMFKQKRLSNMMTPTSTFTLNILLKLNQQKKHQVKIYN